MAIVSAAAAVIVLAAGAATAATGFGFNLVSTPLLTLFLPPHAVVVLTLWLGTIASGILLARPHTRANIEWPLMRPLLVSSLPGMPLGAAALVLWDARALRALIAGLTFVFASLMLARIRPRAGASRWGLVGVGIVSGFLSTSTSMNGPLLAFYLVARGVPKERFRANMLVFIFLVSLMSAILLSVRGTITPDSHGAIPAALAAAALPALLVGLGAGFRLTHRLSERRFEHAVLVLLAVVGMLGVVQALR